MKTPSIGIILATKIEAEPFVNGLGLEIRDRNPVPLYSGGTVLLAQSGIGMTAAAIATALLVDRHHPSIVLNCGAAGATGPGHPVGSVYHIDRVVEPDRPRLAGGGPVTHTPDLLAGFPTASLATRDRPVLEEDDRDASGRIADLVDMEGAAVVQACRTLSTPVYIFKVVSDTHGFSTKEIIASMTATGKLMFEFFRDSIAPGL